ncbi:MAG: 2,3-bisphosphoglycerate-independent phosphoglycerate mutase [Elusimicrobiota bacterium]
MMIGEKILNSLVEQNNTKILMVVMDGVGDIPDDSGQTALEQAKTPNLDKLARQSSLGLAVPVERGITPGSGPGHLALFGYDPVKNEIGRGVLEASGIGIDLEKDCLAVRGNFATRDSAGIIKDRRAGRITTEKNKELCKKINSELEKIEDVEVKVYPGKEHRFVIIFKGPGLNDNLLDADPQHIDKKEKFVEARDSESEKAQNVANEFIKQVQEILKDEDRANTCLLRGLAKKPDISGFFEKYGLKARALATYPMYKGLARLVGMDIAKDLKSMEDELKDLEKNSKGEEYNFFYFHVKKTDSYGEDGNRSEKVKVIEHFDKLLSQIIEQDFDVICITADHSTPTPLKAHSWHPVPLLINGPYIRVDGGERFTEKECLKGSYSQMYSKDIMKILLSQADRLKKFGA